MKSFSLVIVERVTHHRKIFVYEQERFTLGLLDLVKFASQFLDFLTYFPELRITA